MTLDPPNRWDPATFESEGGAVDDVTQTNGKRATRANVTLERYKQLSDSWRGRDEEVTDLLADLMHLCHREGTNFGEALKLARMHYRAESAHRRSRAAQKALKRRQQKRSAAVLVLVR